VVDSHAFAARQAISRLMDYLPQGGESQTLAFFELGCESSSLQIRCAGQFVHHREMAVGGAALTQEIASRQGGTWAQAEQQKIHAHRSAPWVKERVAAFVDKLTTDLSQALQAFNREGAYPPVTHVMLAGGSAELAGLVESLGARVHAPCVLLDPFVGMTPGAALCAGQIPHKPAYLTACGLALRRFLP
jgi:type IV pilus assembly protein PilM